MSIARAAPRWRSTGSSGSTFRGCAGSGWNARSQRGGIRPGALLLFDPNNIRYVTSSTSASGRATRTPASCSSAATPIRSSGLRLRRAPSQMYAPWLPESSWRAGRRACAGRCRPRPACPRRWRRRRPRAEERGLKGEPVGVDMRDGRARGAAPCWRRDHRRRSRDALARKIRTEKARRSSPTRPRSSTRSTSGKCCDPASASTRSSPRRSGLRSSSAQSR